MYLGEFDENSTKFKKSPARDHFTKAMFAVGITTFNSIQKQYSLISIQQGKCSKIIAMLRYLFFMNSTSITHEKLMTSRIFSEKELALLERYSLVKVNENTIYIHNINQLIGQEYFSLAEQIGKFHQKWLVVALVITPLWIKVIRSGFNNSFAVGIYTFLCLSALFVIIVYDNFLCKNPVNCCLIPAKLYCNQLISRRNSILLLLSSFLGFLFYLAWLVPSSVTPK